MRVANQYYAGRELTPDLSTAVYNGKKLEEFNDYGVAFPALLLFLYVIL